MAQPLPTPTPPTASVQPTRPATVAAKQRPQWRDAVAGAAAGAVSRTLMAPVERVKLLQQLRGSLRATTTTSATSNNTTTVALPESAWHVARTVYREQGWRAFWRGNLPNVIRVSGTAALNFTCMDYYKRVATSSSWSWSWTTAMTTTTTTSTLSDTQIQRRRRFWTSLVSGGLAGATATTVLYPVEFLRTRLAMDMGVSSKSSSVTVSQLSPKPREYAGMRDVLQTIWRTDGVRGLFQGYGIALVGGIVYRIILLGGYDAIKGELLFRKEEKQKHRQQQQQQLRHQGQNDRDSVASSLPRPISSSIVSPTASKTESSSLSSSSAAAAAMADTAAQISWGERIVAAQCISLTAGTLCYPLDSVRRRLMMQAGQAVDARQYRNSLHCIQRVWATEGLRGFYLGLGPNLVRSVGGALLLVGYDSIRALL